MYNDVFDRYEALPEDEEFDEQFEQFFDEEYEVYVAEFYDLYSRVGTVDEVREHAYRMYILQNGDTNVQ